MADFRRLPVCIVDTDVLIDLHIGSLLRSVFQLPFLLIAPDVVIVELQELKGDILINHGLTSVELSGSDVQEVYRLASLYRGPSINNLFALAAAKTTGGILLAGNEHLRKAAEGEGVSVHGTLWVLDEMVRLGMISHPAVGRALRRMLEKGRWVPWYEHQRQSK